MAELPFMPIATDAYLADCDHLKDVEHGRYFLILMAMWRAPGQRLPNDDDWLARKFRRSVEEVVAELRPIIAEFCKCDGNWITQKRLTKEFANATASVKRRSDAAKKRWSKGKSKVLENDRKASVTIGDAPASVSAKPLKNNETREHNAYAPTPTPTPTIDSLPKGRESTPAKPRAKKTPLPDGWKPDDSLMAWTVDTLAATHLTGKVHPDRELQKFTNHATTNSRLASKWESAWRNWIWKAIEWSEQNGAKSTNGAGQERRHSSIARKASFAAAFSRLSDSDTDTEGNGG